MSASDALRTSTATPGAAPNGGRHEHGMALNGDGVGGARLLLVDVGVRSLLMGEGRQRALMRVFGVPREDQSFLATVILIGAGATVLRGFAPRWPRPSRADAAMGGSLLNATLRGAAGAPSQHIPLAGALIAVGVLSHSLRPAVAGSAREVRALAREVRVALGARYGG
jgi:hypothetical protein